MKTITRFLLLFFIKSLRYIFYPTKVEWISKDSSFQDIRLILVLNHTSLYEFLYAGALPTSYLWKLAKHLTFPVAQETMKKPIMGSFLRWLAPKVGSLSRKRDETWRLFLESISSTDMMIYFPEGRMKRVNGLDRDGKKMTVRGGTLEVLSKMRGSNCLLVYSSGLHHVCPPHQKFPSIFKILRVRLEKISIDQLLDQANFQEDPKQALSYLLELKRDRYCGEV